MMATRIDVSKPLVLGALISTTALLLKMVFEVEGPFIAVGAPGLVVVWILAAVLSSGNGPPAFVEWVLLPFAYVVVNTVVWAAGLRLLGISSRMARPPNGSEAENQ